MSKDFKKRIVFLSHNFSTIIVIDISFKRITMESLIKRLTYISEKENIDIENEAIKEIAYYSNGGLRDAIGMLDKLNSFSNSKITADLFKSLNGMIAQQDIEDCYKNLLQRNVQNVFDIVDKVENQGYDFKNFIERIMIYAKDKVIDYYINKSEVVSSVNDNILLVESLNDILNILYSPVNL